MFNDEGLSVRNDICFSAGVIGLTKAVHVRVRVCACTVGWQQ